MWPPGSSRLGLRGACYFGRLSGFAVIMLTEGCSHPCEFASKMMHQPFVVEEGVGVCFQFVSVLWLPPSQWYRL